MFKKIGNLILSFIVFIIFASLVYYSFLLHPKGEIFFNQEYFTKYNQASEEGKRLLAKEFGDKYDEARSQWATTYFFVGSATGLFIIMISLSSITKLPTISSSLVGGSFLLLIACVVRYLPCNKRFPDLICFIPLSAAIIFLIWKVCKSRKDITLQYPNISIRQIVMRALGLAYIVFHIGWWGISGVGGVSDAFRWIMFGTFGVLFGVGLTLSSFFKGKLFWWILSCSICCLAIVFISIAH